MAWRVGAKVTFDEVDDELRRRALARSCLKVFMNDDRDGDESHACVAW